MARQRTLHPNFFVDEKVVQVSAFARLMFQGLWCLADREGRLERKPLKLKMQLFPADAVDGEALICELEGAQLVKRYEVEGAVYLLIPGFTKHQHVHPKEVPSKLPAPPSPGKQVMHEAKAQAFGHATGGQPGLFVMEQGGSRAGPSGPSGPSVKKIAPRKKRAPPPEVEEPGHQELVDALCAAFERETGTKYPFSSSTDPNIGSRNGKAVKALRGMGIAPTVVAVWVRALRHQGFPRVRMLWELVEQYPHFVAPQSRSGPDPNTGIIVRTDNLCAVCGEGAEAQVGGQWLCYGQHLAAAEAWAQQQKPDAPWEADVSSWVASQRSQGAAA